MTRPRERHLSQDNIKRSNMALVYQIIDLQGPISRVSIVQESELAPASVTNLTRQLIEFGLVKEVSQQASTGGRPAISLVSNNQAFFFVSCRLGREQLQCSIMDLTGQMHSHHVIDIQHHDAAGIVQLLTTHIEGIRKQCLKQPIIAVAITMAGLIDATSGIVHYSPNHDIANLNLPAALSGLGLPVYVGNDIRALALAEYYFGMAQGCLDYILVSIHGGVGSGIVSDGQLLLGKHRTVGEIGHVQIDAFGKRCHCGNFGCLETIVSNSAIVAHASELLGQGHPSSLTAEHLDIERICQAANDGDEVASHVITFVGQSLGKVLAMMVNVFNPEKLLLAGEIVRCSELLFPVIRQQIARQALGRFQNELSIDKARYQEQSTIGGFALVKRALHHGKLLLSIANHQE